MPHSHLANARHVIKRLPAKLHVIAVVFNPLRFQSRYNLYREFAKHAIDAGADLWTVEVALGERPFEVTSRSNPKHIQLRTKTELWHKERMINLAVQRLPIDWQYVAWVDADLTFVNPDWVHETMQQLQHYPVVQMFSHAMDLGSNMEPLPPVGGFAYTWAAGNRELPILGTDKGPHSGARYWHPGFAWAYTRDAWNTLGGMLDVCIIGSGDYHMAYALVNQLERTIPHGSHPQYIKMVRQWGDRASLLKQNIGAVPGTVMHHFHGPKKHRGYATRWKMLVEHEFDPVVDLTLDWQGLFTLSHASPIKLRDDLRSYFRARNEDSI
jgi:hypothetical protein